MKQDKRIQAKRSLGQNFLTDKKKASRIAELMEANAKDTILEIGPGCGDLTQFLLHTGAHVHEIELDERAIDTLHDLFEDESRFTVDHGDVLKFNLREYAMNILQASGEHRKLKVAGNIPYYITSDILFKLFEHADIIDRAVIMMQKEVAERICAQPRTKAYGILSIAARFVSAPNIALKVPSGCFTPRPSVDSAVVVFDFSKASITMEQFAMVHPIVRTAFGQRRKMLSNALHTYINAYGKELPEDIQSMMQKRAEELLPEHFLRLAECFTQS